MKIDLRVTKINELIKEQGREIFSGQVPEMNILETEISEFINIICTLPTDQVRDYANLVNIWAVEVKKMSDKLNQTKAQLNNEMEQARMQGRAVTAYAAANKFTSES